MRLSLSWLLLAASLEAQSIPLTLSGVVLDAASKRPIAIAGVDLRGAGVARDVRVDSLGRYLIRGLTPGEYVLSVRALGYAPARLEVRLAPASAAAVSVGLEHRPVYLERVDVLGERRGSFSGDAAIAGSDIDDDARALLERSRQRRFLASDARLVTFGDVARTASAVQPDLLRAIQALPGVSARDDYSAELWTRGSPWSQTRVTLDGIPLYNPLHAAGAASAIGLDVIGEAVFHPGVQSTRPGGGAAGHLALASASPSGPREGSVELSMASAGASARGALDGRTAAAAALRRSHVDLWPRVFATMSVDSTASIPYAFSDAIVRVDRRIGARWTASATGFLAADELRGSIRDIVRADRARWGSAGGRATLVAPMAYGTMEHTVGITRFGAVGSPAGGAPENERTYAVQRTDNAIRSAWLDGEWRSAGRDDADGFVAGYRLAETSARYFTAGDWPRDSIPRDTLRGRGRLAMASVWAERRQTLGALSVRAGAVLDGGGEILLASRSRIAPRVSARWTVDSATAVSAAYGRAWQYEQTLMQSGGARHAIATSAMFWMVAGPTVPAIHADLFTIGGERWIDRRMLASITAYDRRTGGMTIATPWSGGAGERPRWVIGGQHARGVEASLRRLSGRTTVSANYTYQRADLDAAGIRFPSPWERRHSFQVRAWTRVVGTLHAGAAVVAATGAPFTQFVDGKIQCDTLAVFCYWREPPMLGDASAAREPAYRTLDLAMQWGRAWRRGDLVVYGSVKNVLGIGNPAAYLESRCAAAGPPSAGSRPTCVDPVHDRLPGLGRLPTIGLRFTF